MDIDKTANEEDEQMEDMDGDVDIFGGDGAADDRRKEQPTKIPPKAVGSRGSQRPSTREMLS